MKKESIQGPLSALRNAGTVCGVCLTRGTEILVNLFPFSESRINDMVSAIEDIQTFFRQNNRQVDQMSFGYDGGCLCIVEDDEFRLIVMHMLADEVDFIAKASLAFLADFQLDLFAEQIASGNTRLLGLVTEPESPSPSDEIPGIPGSDSEDREAPSDSTDWTGDAPAVDTDGSGGPAETGASVELPADGAAEPEPAGSKAGESNLAAEEDAPADGGDEPEAPSESETRAVQASAWRSGQGTD